MADYWIGTSGWNYQHWRGIFYPEELPPRAWLRFYAGRFRTAEINYSHYRQPSDKSWDSWRQETPQGFRFAVKAHRYLTHRLKLSHPEDALSRVLKGAERLGDKLGPILYQFPAFFHRTEENSARLEHFLEILPPRLQHAFEFRHESWFDRDTFSQLERHGAAFCSFDMTGMECPLVVTAAFAYIRFHGPSMKYGGHYTDAMLEDWARRIEATAGGAAEVYIYFNNDIGGAAPDNAATLARLLGAPRPVSTTVA